MQTQTHALPLTISTDSQWQAQFRTWLFNRKPRLVETSITLAMQHINVFAKWHEAQYRETFDPTQLTNYDLQLYRRHSLQEAKVAARTWNSRRWALDLLCQHIGAPHLIEGITEKAAGRASTKHRSLTKDEYNRLMRQLSWLSEARHADTEFAHHNNLRTVAEITLMNQAGLRVGELTGITLGDITINERSGEILVRDGKGSKERTVQLNSTVRAALTNWIDIAGRVDPQDRIETTSLFRGRDKRSIQRDVEAVSVSIGIPELTCHWLRYDLAKRLERAGKPLELIRDVLGHGSIEQTKRYLRSSAEDIQSALEEVA